MCGTDIKTGVGVVCGGGGDREEQTHEGQNINEGNKDERRDNRQTEERRLVLSANRPRDRRRASHGSRV